MYSAWSKCECLKLLVGASSNTVNNKSSTIQKVLPFTEFLPNVGKTFTVVALSVITMLKKATIAKTFVGENSHNLLTISKKLEGFVLQKI